MLIRTDCISKKKFQKINSGTSLYLLLLGGGADTLELEGYLC